MQTRRTSWSIPASSRLPEAPCCPQVTARNAEQAPAYAFGPRHQLAQLVATGSLSRTFYADAQDQLDQVLALTRQLEPAFVAKGPRSTAANPDT